MLGGRSARPAGLVEPARRRRCGGNLRDQGVRDRRRGAVAEEKGQKGKQGELAQGWKKKDEVVDLTVVVLIDRQTINEIIEMMRRE